MSHTSECVAKGHGAPFQAFADAYFGRQPNIPVIGSRALSGKAMMSLVGRGDRQLDHLLSEQRLGRTLLALPGLARRGARPAVGA